MRVNAYIDGFNLYYRALRKTPHKWLNLHAMISSILPRDTINRIRYFTAPITPRPNDLTAPQRQQAYLRALQTIPNLTIHYGNFLTSPAQMMLAIPPATGSPLVNVLKTEEKGSDVNLATMLLCDAFDGDFELAAVVTNDSDLALPIEMVRDKFGLKIGVLSPTKKTTFKLQQAATFHIAIHTKHIRNSQFPPVLFDAQGNAIHKPASW
jgi:hypothetical protein